MQQYFLETKVSQDGMVYFTTEQNHHIQHVLRMKEDTIVKVVDVDGRAFLVALAKREGQMVGLVKEALPSNVEPIHITLIQGMIKGDRWDFLIQKACEVGVTTIVPMVSSRSVVKINDKIDKKLVRFNKIALEACEQAKRDHLVEVKKPIMLSDIGEYLSDLNLIAYEEADVSSDKLKDLLEQSSNVRSITIVIGSEGGFSSDEIKEANQKGFVCASLGTRILRAETAAFAAIQSIRFFYE